MKNVKQFLVLIAGLSLISVCQAGSVNEWGPWQAEDDVVAAILAGADPVEVTAPTAAGPAAGGSVAQSVIPVALDNPNVTQEGMPRSVPLAPTASIVTPGVIDNLDVSGGGVIAGEIPSGDQPGRPDRSAR